MGLKRDTFRNVCSTFQQSNYDFKVYTYNRSTNVIYDENDDEIRDYDTSYNWNDKEDK